MKRKLVYVNVLSKNQKELIDFYTNVLGLNPFEKEADPASESWYGFETDGAQFAIEPMSNRDKYDFEYNKGNPVLIQFKAESMEDLTQLTEKLEKAGVTIGQRIMKKSYGTVTTFVDLDGNCVEILFREHW